MIPHPSGGTTSAGGSARATAAGLLAALALAAAVRVPRVLADTFPINDGGVFFFLIGGIAGGGMALPEATSYNHADIPASYPPLAFYTAAAIHLATGAPVLELLRVLPVAVNLATVAAFFFLARAFLGATWLASLAALTFAVLPRSYEYMIMGGGLTRSFGFLFACVAVACARRLVVERRMAAGVGATVALALAVLSHPEMGLWAAASVVLVLVSRGLDRWTVAAVAAVGAGAAGLAAPWLAVTLARHGLAPFVAAAHTSSWGLGAVRGLASRGMVGETGLVPLTALAFVGALAAVARRELLLPVWLVLTFVVVPRSAPTPATIPAALLVARALAETIAPAVARRLGGPGALHSLAAAIAPGGRARPILVFALIAPALVHTLLVSNLLRTPEAWPSMRRVPPAEREAMAWIAANVASDARFAVVTGVESWWCDPVDAWFPALTGRESLATPNGAEWLPGGVFAQRVRAHEALQRCGAGDADCLARWAEQFGMPFSHLYVSGRAVLAGSHDVAGLSSAGFAVIHAGPGATVLARRARSGMAGPGAGGGDAR